MSFRAIEDLVDDSLDVLAIARAAGSPMDFRGLTASLFAFSDRHDTQFTRFRDIDRLIENGFVYRLPTACYPGARELEPMLETSDLVWVEPAPRGGYVSRLGPGHEAWLYVEAGSPVWRDLVNMAVLTGGDAERPRILSPIDLAVAMAELAVTHDRGWLAVDWYALITVELGGMTNAGIRRHAKLKRLRALAAPHAERLADLETYVREAFGDDLADWWLTIGTYQPVGQPTEENRADVNDWAAWWLSASGNQPAGQVGEHQTDREEGFSNTPTDQRPLEVLVTLVSEEATRAPQLALYAARALRQRAEAFFQAPQHRAWLAQLFDALEAASAADLLPEDPDFDGDTLRNHLCELAAAGGMRAVPVVTARAVAAFTQGAMWEDAWLIASSAQEDARVALWKALTAAHLAATVAMDGRGCSLYLYDLLLLSPDLKEEGLVTADWLAAIVTAECDCLVAGTLADDEPGRVRALAKVLKPTHPEVANRLQAAWTRAAR